MDPQDLSKLRIQLRSLIKESDAATAAELEALSEKLEDLESLTTELIQAIADRVAALERRPTVLVGGGSGPTGPQGPPGPPGPVANGYFPGGW